MVRLLLFLLLSTLVLAESPQPPPDSVERLSEAQIVFLGENHTDSDDHAGQLQVLQAMHHLDDKPLLVAAEMFTERSQEALECWTEEDFDPELWQQEWGHAYQLYRPIFSWLKQQKIALCWLRPNPERTAEVRKRGAIAALPLLGEVLLGPESYRQHMAEVAAKHLPEGGEVSAEMVDRYFAIQCFWDEFMAWRIARLADLYPDHRIVVLVGHGHLQRQGGIPWRLRRRAPQIEQLAVGFRTEHAGWADMLWSVSSKPR